MNKKEKDELKNEIVYRNEMTKKLIRTAKFCFLFFILFGAIAIWGFTGMHDNFLPVSDGVRNVLKWIGLVVAIVTGILTVLYYLSYHNSKKYVFALIDKVQGK